MEQELVHAREQKLGTAVCSPGENLKKSIIRIDSQQFLCCSSLKYFTHTLTHSDLHNNNAL